MRRECRSASSKLGASLSAGCEHAPMDGVLPASIGSGRLHLRTWRRSDAESLARVVATSLEHLRPWMPWVEDEPLSSAQRVELFDTWERGRLNGGDAFYAVVLDGELVGGCGLHRRIGPAGLEVGYWISASHVRGGLASGATVLLTSEAFAQPQVEVVEVHHDKSNVASAGVPRQLGFTLVSELPDEIVAPGEVGIELVWRMRRGDWPGVEALGGRVGHLLRAAE